MAGSGRDCRIGTEGQKREAEVSQEDQSLYENIITKPLLCMQILKLSKH